MVGKGSAAQISGLSLCLNNPHTIRFHAPHISPSTLSSPVSTDVGCLPRLGGSPVFLPHPLSPLSAVLLLRVAPAGVSGVTLKGGRNAGECLQLLDAVGGV